MKRKQAFPQGRRAARPIDQATLSQAVKTPREQWISVGLVTAGDENDDIVVFDEEEGQPLVRVLLEPSKTPVFARVGAQVAGRGEGEWHPFVEGDEVLVAIPEGNERAGCVIICRLCNAIDRFPMESVAGQDPTTNTFAFSRRRTPRVEEFAGPIVMRSAASGALLALDNSGVFTVRTGDKAVLQMSPDAIGFQGPSDDDNPPELMMQLNVTGKHFSLTVGDALLNLSASDAEPEPNNILSVPDNLTINAGGNASSEHLMTVEAFWHALHQVLQLLGVTIAATGPTPLTGTSLGSLLSLPASLLPIITSTIPLAASAPMNPVVAQTLSGAWTTMSPKQPASTQLQPGLGSATIIVG